MKKTITLAALAALAAFAVSANATVTLTSTDFSAYLNNIDGTAAGAQATFDVDTGAAGYIEVDGGSLAAAQSGGTVITVSQIGSVTLGTIGDMRVGDEVGGVIDTDGVVMDAVAGTDGFNISATPGAAGSGTLTVHVGTWQAGWNYDLNGDVGLADAGAASQLHEGTLVFNFTTTSAADTLDLDLTSRINGIAPNNAYIGAARLDFTAVPEPAAAALLCIGGLALIRRRRK